MLNFLKFTDSLSDCVLCSGRPWNTSSSSKSSVEEGSQGVALGLVTDFSSLSLHMRSIFHIVAVCNFQTQVLNFIQQSNSIEPCTLFSYDQMSLYPVENNENSTVRTPVKKLICSHVKWLLQEFMEKSVPPKFFW